VKTLNHEEPEAVPFQWMSFWNDRARRKFLPEDCLEVTSNMIDRPDLEHGPVGKEALERVVRYHEFLDSYIAGVGLGGNQSLGHGGPGELYYRVTLRGEDYLELEYENGARRVIRDNPHSIEFTRYPLTRKEDLDSITLPDLADPGRFAGIREEVEYYRENDLFVTGAIMGFFAGVHNNFYDFESFCVDLILDPDFSGRLIRMVGEFNLEAAERLIDCGVDCITLCDDLGSLNSLIISPEMYRKYFFPWHRELCELCHSKGCYVQLHSHGNINEILQWIVEAGFDILNPVDPLESMDLAAIKEEYGDRITIAGGIHRDFYLLSREELRCLVEKVVGIGRRGGGFILMDAGGVPPEMPVDLFRAYLDFSREYRRAG